MMVRIFDKMKDERKKMILSEADKFIKKNTIL
jgi:deoxyribodipyrimidine photolyase-related protein